MARRPFGPWLIVPAAALVILALGLLLVRAQQEAAGPALYVVPVAAAIVTYLVLRRLLSRGDVHLTRHEYTVMAAAGDASLRELLEPLGRRGYELQARTVSQTGQVGGALPPDTRLLGARFQLTDRRAPPDFGELVAELSVQGSGRILGFLRADDSGPGFYDELALYTIAAFHELLRDVGYIALGSDDRERKEASDLAGELPERPLGIGLL